MKTVSLFGAPIAKSANPFLSISTAFDRLCPKYLTADDGRIIWAGFVLTPRSLPWKI